MERVNEAVYVAGVSGVSFMSRGSSLALRLTVAKNKALNIGKKKLIIHLSSIIHT
jgi:hypothetical protein